MRLTIVLSLFLSVNALAAEPTVDEIVKRARAVAEKKPKSVTCQMSMETQLFDKTGKLEHRELREGHGFLDGDKADLETTKAWRDGKPVPEADIKSEREKAKKQKNDDLDISPLAAKNADSQHFELLRKEPLWGHDAYVIKVTATRVSENTANGTLWIDADSFVELKGELVPSKLPDHADWLRVQEQFLLDKGVPLPSYLHVTGAGHFLMFKKSFESTLKWSSCK